MTDFIDHAVVIGATGLVGRALIAQLDQCKQCKKITAIVRNNDAMLAQYPKVNQLVVADFMHLTSDHVSGCSHAFSCLGTTLKKAGSRAAFYHVDFTINAHFAALLQQQNIHYLLVSAMAADAQSIFFYNRVKGELENYIRQLALYKVSIFRPSLLLGERQEQRFLEQTGQKLYSKIARLLPGKFAYRPVTAEQVAKSMQGAAERQIDKFVIYDNLALQGNFKG